MSNVGKSMFPVRSSFSHITNMKAKYDKLQGQLATGQRAANLAEMGPDRFFDLSMRTRLGKISAYTETMKTVDLRLEILGMTVSRLDEMESTQRTSITPGAYGTGNINFSTVPTVALARFDEAMTMMNAHVGGRYLFAGGKTDVKPLASADVALNGEAGRAGFRTVAGERLQADQGATGLGRVGITTVTDTVTVTEDGDHPFGFKLSTLASSSGNVTLTQPGAVQPRTLSIQFGATLPADGDVITVTMTLPDGSTEAIQLTATTDISPEPGEFQLGANADTTAASFGLALTTAIETMADTKLAAASSYAAADNFFNGQGEQVMRVNGPPFNTATSLVAATSSNTVFWYQGEDAVKARHSVDAKVDDGTHVNYGVQANETGLVGLIRTLAANAIAVFSSNDPTAAGRFDAMALRQMDRLAEENSNQPGAISVIAVELGLAKTTMNHVRERQTVHSSQLQSMLAGIENIPTEEVAMEILSLKTRLEASFETTSLVAQLSLVHYLR